eukprot:TRINITY_DN389_c0_g1_i1.p1 TRINITY_DN389_c0_g1~~TRINITY_DN389_c0_g1_i1.p1  ORF type:complete len:396 (+),score=145.32 TRINITY_DN389_c0_g1_i1:112-1299(+)
MKLVVFFSCLIVLFNVINCGLYNSRSDVINIDQNNFGKMVLASDHVWLMEFYAPWCGHCKNLAPTYEQVATNLKGIVKVGAINCDEESNKQLCGMFGIQGFPTLKLFPSERTENPYQKGAPWKKPIDYQQARSAPALANFALSHLPNYVITGSNVDTTLNNENDLNKVILFSSKDKVTNLYKSLAIDFRGRLDFVQTNDKKTELVEKYSIDSYPTLCVVDSQGELLGVYDGKLKHDLIETFLNQYSASVRQDIPNQKPAEPEPTPEPEEPESPEIESQEDLDRLCINKSGTCGIAVLDTTSPEHETYLETLQTLAVDYFKQFRFMWIDAAKHPNFLQQLEIDSGFPQFIVLNPSKKVAGQLLGSFTNKKISEFLGKVKKGSRRAVYYIDDIPTLD